MNPGWSAPKGVNETLASFYDLKLRMFVYLTLTATLWTMLYSKSLTEYLLAEFITGAVNVTLHFALAKTHDCVSKTVDGAKGLVTSEISLS